jgi:transposase InsO family protein
MLRPNPPLLSRDWSKAYQTSLHWSSLWDDCEAGDIEWPEHAKIHQGKLFLEEKLAVPEEYVEGVIREHHRAANHPGVERLLKDLLQRYAWPSDSSLKGTVERIRKECMICQASEPPHWSNRGPISCTIVPERFMASVAMDLFSMPEVTWQSQQYDCYVLMVDRLTGWMVARPSLKKGLTGEKAAHLFIDGSWGELGIPNTITSDQGSQFVSQWWLTMCSRLGARSAFSQAHRPQANGRAEV